MKGSTPCIQVRRLRTVFPTPQGEAAAVDGVSFDIYPGETLAIVGESGCGKSMTALSLLRLVPPPGRIAEGELFLEGKDVMAFSYEERRAMRGGSISMIFQEPMTSLNPVLTVGYQIREAIRIHRGLAKEKGSSLAIDMLQRVGIPDPEERIQQYPHQLSGGMKQRVMIAMALICKPSLLIADEPTTALDVTIQAQILSLMKTLQEEMGMAVLLITHDLGVVCEMADRVLVMYGGRLAEAGSLRQVFKERKHPYTQGLFESIPVIGKKEQDLHEIPGRVPELWELPKGCAFSNRCPHAMEHCPQIRPEERELGEGHSVWCHLYE